ncbi:MAG: hypothetical protein CMJ46_15590 [Planctomyces sp.]|nr:hypothetical protein [Planctomyces sp.]
MLILKQKDPRYHVGGELTNRFPLPAGKELLAVSNSGSNLPDGLMEDWLIVRLSPVDPAWRSEEGDSLKIAK